jgi:hypothetical protein
MGKTKRNDHAGTLVKGGSIVAATIANIMKMLSNVQNARANCPTPFVIRVGSFFISIIAAGMEGAKRIRNNAAAVLLGAIVIDHTKATTARALIANRYMATMVP